MEFNLSRKQILIMREIRLRGEGDGLQIKQRLIDNFGVSISEGVLYPNLRELETNGFLVTDVREENLPGLGMRNRYYYNLTGKGRRVPLPVDEQGQVVAPNVDGLVPT